VRIDRIDPARIPSGAGTPEERLAKALELRAERAVIYVDDQDVVALPSRAEAEAVLEEVKAALAGPVKELEAPPSFKQQVEVRTETVGEELWADRATAAGLLRGEDGETPAHHSVGRGETAWDIARKYRLTLEQLSAQNAGVNLDRLQVGQQLRVGSASEPLVTVVTEGRMTRTLPSPFGVVLRRSPAMFVGKRMLVHTGRPGRQRIVYRVRAENGRVVRQEILSRQTVQRARDQVVIVGAKPRP
jgi:hypothetical protein